MSTQIGGLPVAVLTTQPPPVNIASTAISGAVCLVSTAPNPHGLNNGDFCSINGHAVNGLANGQWPATVLTSTTFTIPVTVFGSGGATGTVQSLSLPSFPIPSDADPLTAASVGPAFEANADRTAFFNTAMPIAKLVVPVGASVTNDTFTAWDHVNVGALPAATWVDLAGATVWTLWPGLQVNDEVSIDLDLNEYIQASGASPSLSQLALFYRLSFAGIGPFTRCPGSGAIRRVDTSVTGIGHVHIATSFFAPNAGPLEVKLMARQDGTNPTQWQFEGDYRIRAQILRGTGAPPA